jgi:hypothetical protein
MFAQYSYLVTNKRELSLFTFALYLPVVVSPYWVGWDLQVEIFRNDQHRVKIVIDTENEVDLMVQSRHIRDVVVLVVRGLAQRYNSTSLNHLLKM